MTRLAFTNHVLDVSSRQLFRSGAPVHLAPKIMDLLLCLVANAERYVSKEELQRALWTDVSVGASSLPGLVKELRRALLDTGQESVLVRTLHGRGYQFAAELTRLDAGSARTAHAESGPRADPRPSMGNHACVLDSDTAVSLPPDFQADARNLGVVSLWPPRAAALQFAEDRPLRLGRAETSDLFLPYEKVSRAHAEIMRKGPVFVLRDLGSTNGSFVDGERVREGAVLRRDQLLRLGEWLGLVVEVRDQNADVALLAVPAGLRDLVGTQDWSGQVRALELACRARLDAPTELTSERARPAS